MKHYLVRELYTNMPQQDVPEVKVNGWVRTKRESKAFAFVELNDGTYFRNLQIILEESKLSNYAEATRAIGVGAAIEVTGTLVLTPDMKQPFELKADSVTIVGESPSDYPLQKKRHTLEYLRTIQHLRPRAQHAAAHARKPRRQRTRAAAQVQDGLLRVLRDELKQLRTVFGHEVVLLIVQRRVPFHMRFPHCFGIYLYYSTVREKCNRSEPRGRIFQRWRGLFGPALYFAGICAIIVPAMRKREIYAVLQLFRGRGHVRRHAH